MTRKKVRLALAVTAVSVGAAVSPVAIAATPAQAAQCVNLTGHRTWSGFSRYAEVRNICSGTYRFSIRRSDNVNIGCYTIQGGVFADYVYAYTWESVTPTRIVYC
ncbi:hypothetical protein [Couchioplanes azureus]|uniref:hypothetical protein n=1 Tax=Couchioplanes caeruleus TaxID=56438 RepID=UPI00166F7E15|nr:hypothetical protein [Couchioplanes caeruleus]GGQ59449.1 hypothetical protein GCM10010166_31120 [Couchioplanes caeruleus subsp. azureus]